MDPARWKQVDALLQAALQIPAEEQDDFVRSACGQDAELQKEVRSLISSHRNAGQFLAGHAINAEAQAVAAAEMRKLREDLIGKTLSHYRVLRKIGSGGMGAVYEAEDVRLGRRVAMKLVLESEAANQKALQRFELEARAISSLNHPNICTLYEVEDHEGTPIIIMELLQGETLGERLEKESIPVAQLLQWAIDLSDALEAAHSARLVHRDLKPANLFLTERGQIKILDFGLAKLTLPTVTAVETTNALTSFGTIAGTTAYMSPEQIRGEDLDGRSDLFSLGTVLYEIATRKRPFAEKNAALTMTAVLTKKPEPLRQINAEFSPELESIVERCLEKDRELRYQSAADLRADLKRLKRDTDSGTLSMRTFRSRPRTAFPTRAVGISLGVLLLLAITAILFLKRSQTPPPVLPVVFSDLNLPATAILDTLNDPLALSPDGRTLALALLKPDGVSQLWIRKLDTGKMSVVPGTLGAEYPFWSPDSGSLGFFANGKLMRIDLTSNAVSQICDAPHGRGGTWNHAGTIVFAPGTFSGLSTVPASGGTPKDLGIARRPDDSLRLPHFLPDGDHLLFLRFAISWASKIEVLSLGTKQREELFESDSGAWYTPSGHLVFVKAGSLFANRFDLGSLRLSGQPALITTGVQMDSARKTAAFAASSSGLLVYSPGGDASLKQLQWLSADGATTQQIGTPAPYYYFMTLSQDSKQAAILRANYDVTVVDLITGKDKAVLSNEVGAGSPLFAWSGDGRTLAYTKQGSQGEWGVYLRSISGTADSRLVYTCRAQICYVLSWSNDGKLLAVNEATSQSDVGSSAIVSVETGQELYRIPKSNFVKFSPDSKWLIFMSPDSSGQQLNLSGIGAGAEKWLVASKIGDCAFWPSMGAIYFCSPDGRVMKVALTPAANRLDFGTPIVAFGGRLFGLNVDWDISRDGRVLAAIPIESNSSHSLRLVQNWFATIER
jgi:serine/threonine protein kinase